MKKSINNLINFIECYGEDMNLDGSKDALVRRIRLENGFAEQIAGSMDKKWVSRTLAIGKFGICHETRKALHIDRNTKTT